MGVSVVTLATAPTSGTVKQSTVALSKGLYRTTFVLNAARVPITDATTSGAYGALKLATLLDGVVQYISSYQKYTAFSEGSALTTAAGDLAFNIGVGSAAIAAAADNTLATANKDIGGAISLTNSGGTTTGSLVTTGGKAVDGTSTAATINLNISPSAATSDASSTLDVTGIIIVLWAMVGK